MIVAIFNEEEQVKVTFPAKKKTWLEKCTDVLKFGYKKIWTIKFSDTHLSENKNVRNFLFLM